MPLKKLYHDNRDYFIMGFFFTLVLLLKICLLLAFCYLHATLEEAPHDDYAHKNHPVEYQKKTLC